MKSQWYSLKGKAITLRKKGFSLGYIEKKLRINRSTLSGWFKDVQLTEAQKEKLSENRKRGLVLAQKRGAQWNADQGNNRRKVIREEVEKFASKIYINKTVGELILATFYLAEGGKKENIFVVANSNPTILKGFIALLRYLYPLDESKIRCTLHLRNDQNGVELKKYWSETLNIPISQFLKTQFDKRTIKKTYDRYKGVCVIYYYDMALQRRVLYLGEKILSIIANIKRD